MSIFETQWRVTPWRCSCGDYIWNGSSPDSTKEYGLTQRYNRDQCRRCNTVYKIVAGEAVLMYPTKATAPPSPPP